MGPFIFNVEVPLATWNQQGDKYEYLKTIADSHSSEYINCYCGVIGLKFTNEVVIVTLVEPLSWATKAYFREVL